MLPNSPPGAYHERVNGRGIPLNENRIRKTARFMFGNSHVETHVSVRTESWNRFCVYAMIRERDDRRS